MKQVYIGIDNVLRLQKSVHNASTHVARRPEYVQSQYYSPLLDYLTTTRKNLGIKIIAVESIPDGDTKRVIRFFEQQVQPDYAIDGIILLRNESELLQLIEAHSIFIEDKISQPFKNVLLVNGVNPDALIRLIQKQVLAISSETVELAKSGDEESQLRIISKIRSYAETFIHSARATQYYMDPKDIDQIIASKILEAIDRWHPGGCDIKTLATEYIKRALSFECAGRPYYEGFTADRLKPMVVPQENLKEVSLDMSKIRAAVNSDRNYVTLRMCFGIDGTPKLSYREIGQILHDSRGNPLRRQAIHRRKQRALQNIRKVFTNQNEFATTTITG